MEGNHLDAKYANRLVVSHNLDTQSVRVGYYLTKYYTELSKAEAYKFADAVKAAADKIIGGENE